MASDVNKHLERAKKFLEKNAWRTPSRRTWRSGRGAVHAEHRRRWAISIRAWTSQTARPFTMATCLTCSSSQGRNQGTGHLQPLSAPFPAPQSPNALRVTPSCSRSKTAEEAIEQYSKAAELFSEAGRGEDALFCWERTAQLDPDNLKRQLKVAEGAALLE